MRVSLDPDEIRILDKVIESAHLERARLIAAARSPQDLALLEKEARLLEAIHERLGEAHREDVIDESVEESFPASDSPARGVVKEGKSPQP